MLLAVLCTGWLQAAPAQAKRKNLSIEEQYELGLKFMNRGYYVKSLEQFNRIRNYHRDDPYAVKAELAIADVYFKKSDWDQARLAYEDFMRMHPRHPDLDYVVFRIGLSLYKKAPKAPGRDQTWTRQVVNTWSGYDARFPDSDHWTEVDERQTECRERLAKKELSIAQFYQRRDAWVAVEGRSRNMIEDFPESEYLGWGLEMLATSLAWQGDQDGARRMVERLVEIDPKKGSRLSQRIERIEPELCD